MTQSRSDKPAPVALITGGARRIGAAITRRLHQAGYRVLVHYHSSADEARELCAELNARRPDSAAGLRADLTDREAVTTLARQALQAHGQIDLLVNNASSFYPTPLDESSHPDWDELFDSNARAAWFLCQALADSLRAQQGSIINLVDINARRGMAGFGIYTMAKSALESMTRSLARELAPRVRVNAVAPGAILWPEHLEDPQEHAEAQQHILDGIPLGRLGSPEDIAACVSFLATDALYVSGQTIRVDGGRSLG